MRFFTIKAFQIVALLLWAATILDIAIRYAEQIN